MSEYAVSNEFVNTLMETAENKNVSYESFEGTLNDSCIFYNANNIKIKGIKRAKYIIIKETYVNEWSSKLIMIITDSDKKAQQYENMFKTKYENVNYETA